MQFSYYCTAVYLDTDLFNHGSGWPSSPRRYNPDIGERSMAAALRQVELAEELGFDMVTVSEHHSWPANPVPNCAVLAAAITQRTKKVRIGLLGPLAAINNPVRIAEEVAMLDALSGGRITLLPLRGTPNEFISYGVNPQETTDRTREAQALIARALTEPEPFSWEGRYYRYPTVAVWPGTSQRPLPIFSSGNSEGSVVYAARNHYSLAMSFYPKEMAAPLIALYRAEAKKAGWEPQPHDILYRSFILCTDTDAEVPEIEARYHGELGLIGQMMGRASGVLDQMDLIKVSNRDKTPGAGQAAETQGKFALGDLHFKGSPATMIDQFKEWREETGIGIFDCAFTGGGLTPEETQRGIMLFGEQVMPALREASAVPVGARS